MLYNKPFVGFRTCTSEFCSLKTAFGIYSRIAVFYLLVFLFIYSLTSMHSFVLGPGARSTVHNALNWIHHRIWCCQQTPPPIQFGELVLVVWLRLASFSSCEIHSNLLAKQLCIKRRVHSGNCWKFFSHPGFDRAEMFTKKPMYFDFRFLLWPANSPGRF